ncbi:hypothetical protein GIB67_030582, partial [Kingdonia uniflora]
VPTLNETRHCCSPASDLMSYNIPINPTNSANISTKDSNGTSIDQSVEQTGMGLTISNPKISNTININISQACLIMDTTLLATGNPINTNVILESDHSATTVNSSAILSANTAEKRDLANAKGHQACVNKQREKQKQVSSNQVLSMQQCRKKKVDVVISDSGGTSIDQFDEQNGMGLTILNLEISNTINRDISQACLIMNTALLATGNSIDTNAILESDQSATIANLSVIMSANTAGNQ